MKKLTEDEINKLNFGDKLLVLDIPLNQHNLFWYDMIGKIVTIRDFDTIDNRICQVYLQEFSGSFNLERFGKARDSFIQEGGSVLNNLKDEK